MEYLTVQNLTNPKLKRFTKAILQRTNLDTRNKTDVRTKVLLGLYLTNLERRNIGLRELKKYINRDLSTIWRHIAEFEEAGIAIQVKRGKWQLPTRTLTGTLARALDRKINEFNIALAYAKAIDDQFGITVRETLPIWVKVWIKPTAFLDISDEEKTITSPNQAPLTKTTPRKARTTKENAKDEERHNFGCVAGLYFWRLFGNWGVFVVSYFVYDYSLVPFS